MPRHTTNSSPVGVQGNDGAAGVQGLQGVPGNDGADGDDASLEGTASGAIDFDNQDMTNVAIESGTIDGTTIGATAAAAITCTSLDCSDELHISSANTTTSDPGHIKLTNTTTSNNVRIRIGYKLTYADTSGDYPGNIGQEFAIFETDAQEEAGYVAVNGNTTAIGNAGDNGTLRWYDEDGHPGSYWYMSASGAVTASSDIRLKQNIRYFNDLYDVSSGMQKFKDISFCKWNKKSLSGKECTCDHYGIIAQELEPLFPEFIETQYGGTDPSYNDMKSFKRSAFTTYSLFILQNVIKQNDEEKTKLVAAEAKITALEAENVTLKARLDAIEARLNAGGL